MHIVIDSEHAPGTEYSCISRALDRMRNGVAQFYGRCDVSWNIYMWLISSVVG